MNPPSLVVLDCTNFPIVSVVRSRLAASGIEAMISDFETLLTTDQPFVLLMAGNRDVEPSHDDQKRWMLWLKGNRGRMAAVCHGVVSVKDTSSDSALQEKQAAGMQAMLGMPVKLASNSDEAERIATDLLN